MNKALSILRHSHNLFNQNVGYQDYGLSTGINPTRPIFTRGNERTVITSIYSRISIDAASMDIKHVRLDDEGRYKEDMNSTLNNCLTVEANKDQTGRALLQDIVISMLDEGCVAVVPVDTNFEPSDTSSYGIESMRTGRIIEWYPDHVTVRLYNDRTGLYEDVTIPKRLVAIIENPLYAIMNEHNSTLQRLISKLSMMDSIDQEASSGKIDLIIQLPYLVKTEAKRKQAEERRAEIEHQLKDSKYGVAYIDGTENVTQLNRSVENNMMKQIEYLTTLLFSQLGITQSILDGTADENTMNNYYTRTIEPIMSAITDEFIRKFLTKTGRSQKQSIMYFRDPFKLIPISSIPEVADKFTRNEILSSNEVRQIIGRKPSTDPSADELRNKNLNQSSEQMGQNNQITEEDKDAE